MNSMARSGKDASPHHLLFWDKNLYQPQRIGCVSFMGTNSPMVLTKTRAEGTGNWNVRLWGINTVAGMHFRGCGLIEEKLPETIKYVREMYRVTISDENLVKFLEFVPQKPVKYKLDPLPSCESLETRIREMVLKSWPIHNCSMCKYRCGYLFSMDDGDGSVTTADAIADPDLSGFRICKRSSITYRFKPTQTCSRNTKISGNWKVT